MKKLLLTLLLVLSFVPRAFAAVAIDSQEASALGHAAGTSASTWNFTNTAGNYLMCGFDLSQTSPANAPTIGAVSYNSVTMTQVGSTLVWTGDATSSTQMALFELASPATGTNQMSVAFTFSGSPVNFDMIGGCVSFTGVDVSSPGTSTHGSVSSAFDATIGTTGKSTTVSSTAGNMVVSLVATGSGAAITATAPTSKTWSLNNSSHTFSDDAAMGTQSAGGTVTAAYTGSADYWGIMAVEIKATGGGPPPCQPTLSTLGVSRCGN